MVGMCPADQQLYFDANWAVNGAGRHTPITQSSIREAYERLYRIYQANSGELSFEGWLAEGMPDGLPETTGGTRVAQDANTTWNPSSYPDVPSGQLPQYDGRNTLGILDVGSGPDYFVKNGQGYPGQTLRDDPAIRAGAVSPTHAEGHAIAILRETGAQTAVLTINNPNGPCRFCRAVIENMLPEGVLLTIVWPGGSARFIGNSR